MLTHYHYHQKTTSLMTLISQKNDADIELHRGLNGSISKKPC